MSQAEFTSLFGWMLLINIAIYAWAAIFIIFARDFVVGIQSRIMGVPAEEWAGYYVDYLSRYKLMIIVFNLAPYLGLRIMG